MKPESEAPEIPGYRIEAVLGRGATGVVYRARQVSVDRVVALKVLHRELVGARRAEQRLQREARTTARLAHPNIISAIDMGEIGGVWWYAMELVDGVSLQDRLRDGPLSEREALRLFIPLVEALQHAFERGVVHRDIKPGNILVERGGRARLVDLGLAVADDDPLLTKGGGTLGTPHYISPEQARDPRSADVQSDLWSLGATLYHAVCGRPPFEGESVAEILSAVLYARVTDPAQLAPYLSRGFSLVLRKCLTRDRAHRYATPAELLADLERVRERRSPKVARAGLDPVIRDWRPARRAAGIAAAVVAGLAGVWLVAFLAGRPTPASADAAGAPAEPDPIAAVGEAAAGPAAGLTGALARTAILEASEGLAPEARSRIAEARRRLTARLESEVWEFERTAELQLARVLADRDFAAAERMVAGGAASDLAVRVGPAKLPEAVADGFERWIGRLAERVRTERTAVLAALRSAVDLHVKEKVLPRVGALVAEGNWKAAREILTFAPRAAAEESGFPLRGLSDAEIADAIEPVRAHLDERRAALDAAWVVLDGELRAWVEKRVSDLRDGLVDRTLRDASVRLRADWDETLAARGLSVDRMPIGVPRLANEGLAKGVAALESVELKVADEDARLRLSELFADTSSMWKERRYEEIAHEFETAASESWSTAFRAQIEIPSREARRLQGLLQRAVDGVRARDGQTVTLQLGTLRFTGKLQSGADPLLDGFRMKPERGQELAFVLRGPVAGGGGPQLLPGVAVETLAGLAGTDGASPADRVLLALFRWREGDSGGAETARAAQAALGAGPLPNEDPLLAEIEHRIQVSLAGAQTPQGERRDRAQEKLRLLRLEMLEPGNRDKKLKRMKDILAFEDVLLPSELSDVRGLLAAQVLEGTPSTPSEFENAFKLPLDRIEFAPNRPRVTLRFDFGAGAPSAAGAFTPGGWSADGRGWIAPRSARTDEEMLAHAGPTLLLRDPLRIQTETFEIQLEFEQPADSPPDLFLVSAAGFQVVLTGGQRARCLVETGDAAQAVAHARAGEGGKTFEGLDRGARYGLRLMLNRAGGRAVVDYQRRRAAPTPIEGEWKRLIETLQVVPRGDDKNLSVTVRSFESVRLLKLSIEAARR
ncbi:MAG TPA: serine/threonine-protein kinase [Planctomycetota bacterium]|jgi:serine/threonine-protein kinase|nr:serine/threonine-protein kinase [Planctomycetota bacterium]